MTTTTYERDIQLDDLNPVDFFGVNNETLNLLKDAYPDVKFIARGNSLKVLGEPAKLDLLQQLLHSLVGEVRDYGPLQRTRVIELLRHQRDKAKNPDNAPQPIPPDGNEILRGVNGLSVRAKSPGQVAMVEAAATNDIVFAIGPAGTGKTYTAVAIAVKAMKEKRVKKIVLVRPAVEAGESLGFLPGDLKEKIDPYLRPLYDALEDMITAEKLNVMLEQNIIEIAPLAYMRGRTLNNAYIILDEAQNTTELQLKMFLTRLGMESKIIVTGDETQIDLPKSQRSGLVQGLRLLQNIEGIGFVRLDARDVVRHRLVRDILAAYETLKKDDDNNQQLPQRPIRRYRQQYDQQYDEA